MQHCSRCTTLDATLSLEVTPEVTGEDTIASWETATGTSSINNRLRIHRLFLMLKNCGLKLGFLGQPSCCYWKLMSQFHCQAVSAAHNHPHHLVYHWLNSLSNATSLRPTDFSMYCCSRYTNHSGGGKLVNQYYF